MHSRSNSHNLLSGLIRTISHCLSPTDMAHASGSQALLSVLDAEENGGQQMNGGVPMHTENGDRKSEEEFYGKASRSMTDVASHCYIYSHIF